MNPMLKGARQLNRSGTRKSSERAYNRRRAAALLTAIFVMAVTSQLVISIVDTQVIQYSVLRNTLDYDRARYLAEAGIARAITELRRGTEGAVSDAIRCDELAPPHL